MNYSDYTVVISNDPVYYGTSCTNDANNIVDRLSAMIELQFPNINIDIYKESATKSCKTTGPDEEICEDISYWISQNWSCAL